MPTLGPSPLNICLCFSFLPDFWTQSFILADGVQCGICELLPIPPLDPIPQLAAGKGSLPVIEVALTVEFSLKSLRRICVMWEGHARPFPMDPFPLPLLDSGTFPAQGLWCSQIHHSSTPAPSLMEMATNEVHS